MITAPISPSVPIPTRSSTIDLPSSLPQSSLSWDNYSETPSFSLSAGWTGLVSEIPLLSSWTGDRRLDLLSETDPFVLDISGEEIEALRGDSEEEGNTTLTATGRGELSLTLLVTESVAESGRDFSAEFEDIEGEQSAVIRPSSKLYQG